MNTSRAGRVLVATSGSTASRSAVGYAARDAAARGLTLEIVHVVPPTVFGGPSGNEPNLVVRRAGHELLAHAEEMARSAAPSVEVTTSLLTGSRPDAVVAHGRGADLLVVGAAPHDLVGRLWTGSTVVGIAARATCPVLVVPAGEPREPAQEVLVGLKSTSHADNLLATAFAFADRTGSRLRILHTWHLLSPYDDAIAVRRPTPDYEIEQGRAIERLIEGLRRAHPDVDAAVELVHGQPAYTLVAGSREADVVVISRPLHGGVVHHLGATARAVLRDAACAVLVVPPHAAGAKVGGPGVEIAVTP